jgi:hypothetical protein
MLAYALPARLKCYCILHLLLHREGIHVMVRDELRLERM